MTTKITQNARLITLLRGTNKELTCRQAKTQYGIGNLRARISELRNDHGMDVRSRKNYRNAHAYSMKARDQFGSRAAVDC